MEEKFKIFYKYFIKNKKTKLLWYPISESTDGWTNDISIAKSFDTISEVMNNMEIISKGKFDKYRYVRKYKPTHKLKSKIRDLEIIRCFENGMTKSEISRKYNLSPERIRQIVIVNESNNSEEHY